MHGWTAQRALPPIKTALILINVPIGGIQLVALNTPVEPLAGLPHSIYCPATTTSQIGLWTQKLSQDKKSDPLLFGKGA